VQRPRGPPCRTSRPRRRLTQRAALTEASASASAIWRWLHDDAIKPWQTRSWIFPRDPNFAERAGVALDLYARVFDGRRLRPDEYVICADEKTQLQALGRRHDTVPPGPGRLGHVESDYLCGGAWPTSRPGTPLGRVGAVFLTDSMSPTPPLSVYRV
jgi:hypothetical protein